MDGTSSKISDYNGIILDMILRIRFNSNGYYIKDTMQWMGPVARWLTTEEQMTGDSSLR